MIAKLKTIKTRKNKSSIDLCRIFDKFRVFYNFVKTSLSNLYHPRQRRNRLGYTLLEVMIVVAMMSVMAGSVLLVLSNVQQTATDTKLMHDVATINRATQVYRISGGSFAGLKEPQDVLDRMKTKLKASEAVRMAGLRRSLVDHRLALRFQTSVEAATNEPRAYFNEDQQFFVIATSGGQGIKEFVLEEALAFKDYGEDDRRSSFDLAKVNNWVWDYQDVAPADKSGTAVAAKPSPSLTSSAPGTPPGALRLNPPKFSIVTGTYDLITYPMELTLTNPNHTGSSMIQYAINTGDWIDYVGPIKVHPGQTVKGMATSQDPDEWIDSDLSQEIYSTNPLTPLLEMAFSQDGYSYADLGGPMIPGDAPAPMGGKYGTLTLQNTAAIPVAYQRNDYFKVKWTKDGSSPLTSSSATAGASFSDGFTLQRIPLALTDFLGSFPVTINSASTTDNPDIFTPSAVLTKQLDIRQLKLRVPTISMSERTVTLTLDTKYTDIPVGARMLYSVDGSEPTLTSGQLYNGPFELEGATGSKITVLARVYAPVEYEAWFLPSDSASQKIKLPAATDFYVGGNFYLTRSDVPVSRNIARLTGEGSVDESFDVGSGTTQNSLVGVIRQMSTGPVFAGGDFDAVNNIARPAVVRLAPSGSVDPAFNAGLEGGK